MTKKNEALVRVARELLTERDRNELRVELAAGCRERAAYNAVCMLAGPVAEEFRKLIRARLADGATEANEARYEELTNTVSALNLHDAGEVVELLAANETREERAARLEVEYAERGLAEVQNRCEAEPGDYVSQQLAEERRVCRARVYDAHLKRRLVQLGRADLASRYACGEIAIHPWEERGPVELADAIAAEFAAPAAAA